MNHTIWQAAALAAVLTATSASASGPSPRIALTPVAKYQSASPTGAEIVSIQATSRRAALADTSVGAVEIVSLLVPTSPLRLRRQSLGLAPGEELTSVSFHPRGDYWIAAIRSALPGMAGRVEIWSASTGQRLRRLSVGVDPDSVKIDPTGRWAVVANEAERFTFDRGTQTFDSAPGSLTVVDLRKGPRHAVRRNVALPVPAAGAGLTTSADGRTLERAVDWNGNGVIDAQVDFDQDGTIEKDAVPVGTLDGVVISQKESDGESFVLPLVSAHPRYLEPELVTFSANGIRAYVTLQENNGIVVLSPGTQRIAGYLGLGLTQHSADIFDDGNLALDEGFVALREPDGIEHLRRAGKSYLVTSDEGDTGPKSSKTQPGLPAGGGRTLSIFEASSGTLLGDTGHQLDGEALLAGFYPEDRSDNGGVEPESVTLLRFQGRDYAAVGLERADAVALVSLADLSKPEVVALAALEPGAPASSHAPEGLAHFEAAGRHYLLTANENSGTMTVLEVVALPSLTP